MKIWKKMILLCSALGIAMNIVSCAKHSGSDSSETTAPESISGESGTKAPIETRSKASKEDADIYVTIQQVEISLDDLKERDYVVPVYIVLEKNAGITYSEWGVHYDERCTVENGNVPTAGFSTVASINDEEHFVWSAWASPDGADYPGILLKLDVTIPQNAALGDTYPITYANVSLMNTSHIWNNFSGENWADTGKVGWEDGGITITEESDLTVPTFEYQNF